MGGGDSIVNNYILLNARETELKLNLSPLNRTM